MAWRTRDVATQRIRFVVRATQEGTNMSALCREFGISRPTGYLWVKRFREAGSLHGLGEKSRRPRSSPRKTPPEVEERVVAVRGRYGWGARKLRVKLAEAGVAIPERTVNRILKRNGLVLEERSHHPATKRFERSAPNELWQMDHKGEYRLKSGGWCFPLTILDDHSRFSPGTFALRDRKAESAQECVVEAFQLYGVPDQMLMDHGLPWWSMTSVHGLTRFSVFLLKQDISLLHSAVRHPQTQGKIERYHRTLDDYLQHHGVPPDLATFSSTLKTFREEYNNERPHEALELDVPVTRYQRSARRYEPDPPPWNYPAGAEVYRVTKRGELRLGRVTYPVSKALANEDVMVERFFGKLLVTFRDLRIREIDLATGDSQ